jgi:hypothetical protein
LWYFTFLADVYVNFDFLRAQTRHPDENYWISDEQAEEISADGGGFPSSTDWKDDALNVIPNTEVSIDKARRHLWKQARTKVGILRTVWEKDHPSFNKLATRIFGPKTKLFQLLEEELSLLYEKYCRFLATFSAASSRSSPASRLLKDNRFDSTGMMEKDKYHRIIKQIEEERSGDESLWMQLEEIFNSLAKKHFLSKRDNEELYVALDDDKHHFNYSKSDDTYGLNRCRHIKGNRFGHTAHTAGLSATGFPLCVMFEREVEAQSQVYEGKCLEMFGGCTGNGNPNLQGMCFVSLILAFVLLLLLWDALFKTYGTLYSFSFSRQINKGITFGSDRGYWTPSLLYFCFFYNVVLILLALLLDAFGIPSLLQKKGKQQQ